MSSKPIIVPNVHRQVQIARPLRVLAYICIPVDADGRPMYDFISPGNGLTEIATNIPILLTRNQATVLNFSAPRYPKQAFSTP